MASLAQRLRDSPTFMGWGNVAARAASLLVVTALVLAGLPAPEITAWLLFVTIIALRSLLDMGFGATFMRVVAYAMAGATPAELKRGEVRAEGGKAGPNSETLELIVRTMRGVYARIAVVGLLLLTTAGTAAVAATISRIEAPRFGWMAWVALVVGQSGALWGNLYSAYIDGVDEVARLRRRTLVVQIGALVCNAAVLLAGGGLLGLVLSDQTFTLIEALAKRHLARDVAGGRYREVHGASMDRVVVAAVWPSAWRSAIGMWLTYGLAQLSGIIYAQMEQGEALARYLLTLQFADGLRGFSQAPFYTKIPRLARLFAEDRRRELVALAAVGMRWASWTFAIGFLAVSLLGRPFFTLIDSNVSFPPMLLWYLVALAEFFARYGAMHLQLYSTTNRIVWHYATGGLVVIYVSLLLLLLPQLGVYAFAIAMLAGYLGWYAWYSALLSYREFEMDFFAFERRTALPPLMVMLLYMAITLFA